MLSEHRPASARIYGLVLEVTTLEARLRFFYVVRGHHGRGF